MNVRHLLLALAVTAGAATAASAQQPAGFWTTPAIKGIGPVHVWPQAVLRPDANTTYKVVFDVTKGSPSADKMDPALGHVARAVNVFAAAGIPLDHLKFAVIIHGPATPIALSDKAFKAKFGHANPNLAVIEALKTAGVDLMVCGNALGDMHFTPEEVNPNLKVALSALSTLVILQDQGYGVIAM